MLEIKPIESKEEQENILSLCRIAYKESYFAYKAYEGASLLAAAQFDIRGSEAELDAIEQAAAEEMEQAAQYALNAPEPNPADVLQDVFYEGGSVK